jgi:hypothetical protein
LKEWGLLLKFGNESSNQSFEFEPKDKELIINRIHISVHCDEIFFQQAL